MSASGGTAAGSTPSRAAIVARRSSTAVPRSSAAAPRFEPPEVVASAGPSPATASSGAEAEGRVWNQGSAAGFAGTGSMPMSEELPPGRTEPSAFACSPGRRETPQTTAG